MKRADECIPRILKHEGGFVNHPRDPGGATNKGITLSTYRHYIDPNGTVDDLKRLTTEEATAVYKARYWDRVRADELPVGVDYAVADFAVNSGPQRAIRYLQAAVGANQDGVLGPKTMAAVKENDPAAVVRSICARRMNFLRGLRTWGTFGKGWTRRVTEVERDALNDMRSPTKSPATPVAITGGIAAVLGLIASKACHIPWLVWMFNLTCN